jgi:predicted enzyme related to lactoylglutathione lyase
VPEPKTLKNRVHLGLSTAELDAQIERLVAMGAEVAWEESFPPGTTYRNVILRDPEGNEFCLGSAPEPA